MIVDEKTDTNPYSSSTILFERFHLHLEWEDEEFEKNISREGKRRKRISEKRGKGERNELQGERERKN